MASLSLRAPNCCYSFLLSELQQLFWDINPYGYFPTAEIFNSTALICFSTKHYLPINLLQICRHRPAEKKKWPSSYLSTFYLRLLGQKPWRASFFFFTLAVVLPHTREVHWQEYRQRNQIWNSALLPQGCLDVIARSLARLEWEVPTFRSCVSLLKP